MQLTIGVRSTPVVTLKKFTMEILKKIKRLLSNKSDLSKPAEKRYNKHNSGARVIPLYPKLKKGKIIFF